MNEQDEITIVYNSEPMNEMLSQPPGWMAQSGNGVLLLVLLLILLISWFVRYPDEINGEVEVSGSQAPIELSNQGYIQLKALYVVENQVVEQGDLIAQFDLSVNSEDFSRAEAYLRKLEMFDGDYPPAIPYMAYKLSLGSLGESWARFLSKVSAWNSEYGSNTSLEELKLLRREISFREELRAISAGKIVLSETEYDLIKEQVSSSERLAEQHAISRQSLIQEKRSLNTIMQTVQGQKEQYVQNLIALNSLRKEVLLLERKVVLEKLQRAADIRMALTRLLDDLHNWKKDAAWTAPCSGKVIFNKMLQVNQFYNPNEASVVIVPEVNGYSAVASVVSTGSGKLKAGDPAFIELVDYPKSEFGMLEGTVSRITQMDKEGKYELRVSLPRQLETSYRKHIPPKALLKGKIKIITHRKRLLTRFFEQFTSMIK